MMRANIMRGIIVGCLLALAAPVTTRADTGCDSVRGVFLTTPRRNITLDGGDTAVRLRVRVANTVVRRTAALRCATVASLVEAPVLFDYDHEFVGTQHLALVVTPVDIAYIKEDGRIIAIIQTQAGTNAVSPPAGAFRYVLEVPAGFFEKHAIRQGQGRAFIE
jgi:uncharacterized membrane protein (UPF0127 family)